MVSIIFSSTIAFEDSVFIEFKESIYALRKTLHEKGDVFLQQLRGPGVELRGMFQNGTNHFLLQFTGFEDVFQVLGDCWTSNTEKLSDAIGICQDSCHLFHSHACGEIVNKSL
jgi:hypothetical protein